MAPATVMVVSGRLDVQQAFAGVLAKSGLVPIVAATGSEAETILRCHSIAMIFCSDEMPPSEVEGVIRQNSPEPNRVPTVVVSRLDNWDRYVRFVRSGALDYVLFPLNEVEIEQLVNDVLSFVELKKVRQAAAAVADSKSRKQSAL